MPIVHAIGVGLCVVDELLNAAHGEYVRDDHRVTVFCNQRNPDDIGELVLGISINQRIHRIEIGAQQQVVAVARAREHVERGEQGTGPGLVLDHDRTAERCAQPLGQEARRNVGRSAGGKSDHQPYRP